MTDKDLSHYFGIQPTIDIEKSTNGQDADDPTGPKVALGRQVDNLAVTGVRAGLFPILTGARLLGGGLLLILIARRRRADRSTE